MDSKQKVQALRKRIDSGWPLCEVCNGIISFGRLETLPHTTRCVQHSNEGGYVGVPLYAHKTAATVAMVKADPDAADGMGESVRQLLNGYHRKR